MKATDKQINYFNGIIESRLFEEDKSVWEDKRDDCLDDIHAFYRLLDEVLEVRERRYEA